MRAPHSSGSLVQLAVDHESTRMAIHPHSDSDTSLDDNEILPLKSTMGTHGGISPTPVDDTHDHTLTLCRNQSHGETPSAHHIQLDTLNKSFRHLSGAQLFDHVEKVVLEYVIRSNASTACTPHPTQLT